MKYNSRHRIQKWRTIHNTVTRLVARVEYCREDPNCDCEDDKVCDLAREATEKADLLKTAAHNLLLSVDGIVAKCEEIKRK